MLDAAKRLMDSIREPARRMALTAEYEQVQVPLIEAVQAGHRFVFDTVEERLELAREQVVALFERLLNSGEH